MSQNERQQRMVERIQEDERLRGDLPDDAATALVEWASKRVAAAAADPIRPDAEVEAEVQAIRAAARAAARAGAIDPQRLLAIAEANLAQNTRSAALPTPTPAVAEQPVVQAPSTNLAACVGAGVAGSQPPAATQPPQAPSADVSQSPAPSKSGQPQHDKKSPWFRRWKSLDSFLKRIRGEH